jgi:hypothetical protein
MGHQASHPLDIERDQVGVVAWRRRRLEGAGFAPSLADALATDRGTDLHALLDLVDRGCRPDLAARILAPLEPRDRPAR